MAANGANSGSLDRKSGGFFQRTSSWMGLRSSTMSLPTNGKQRRTGSVGSGDNVQRPKPTQAQGSTDNMNAGSQQHNSFLKFSFRRKKSGATNGDSRQQGSAKSAQQQSFASSGVQFFPMRPEADLTNRFQVVQKLSSGAFGDVLKVIKRDDNREYVVKVMNKTKIMEKGGWNIAEQCKLEIAIHKAVSSHVFVISCFESWQSNASLFEVFELAPNGDLFTFWKKTGAVSVPLTRLVVAQLALALEFLHNQSVIYRDLKLENVLFVASGYIRLCDFGLAKWLRAGQRTRTICGTLLYMAPELLVLEPYGHATDWWSLGICAYALLAGFFPAYGATNHQEMLRLVNVCCFEPPDTVSHECRELIECLLTREPSERAQSVSDLQRCEFYRGFSFQLLSGQRLPVASFCNEQEGKILFGSQFRPQPQALQHPLAAGIPAPASAPLPGQRPVSSFQPSIPSPWPNGPVPPQSPPNLHSSAIALSNGVPSQRPNSGGTPNAFTHSTLPNAARNGPPQPWNPNQSEASLRSSSQSLAQASRDTLSQSQSQSLARSPNARFPFGPSHQPARATSLGVDATPTQHSAQPSWDASTLTHSALADSPDASPGNGNLPSSPPSDSGPSWRRSEPPIGRPESLNVSHRLEARHGAQNDEMLNHVEIQSSEATTSNNSSPVRPYAPPGAVRVLPAHSPKVGAAPPVTATAVTPLQLTTPASGRQIGRMAMRAQALAAAAGNVPTNTLANGPAAPIKSTGPSALIESPALAIQSTPLNNIRPANAPNTMPTNGFPTANGPQPRQLAPTVPGSAPRGINTLPSSRPIRSLAAKPTPTVQNSPSRPLNDNNRPLNDNLRPNAPSKPLAFAVSGSLRMRHVEPKQQVAPRGAHNHLDLSDRMLELHRVSTQAYNDLQGSTSQSAVPNTRTQQVPDAAMRNGVNNRSPTATVTTSSNNEHSEHEFETDADEDGQSDQAAESDQADSDQAGESDDDEDDADADDSQRNTLTESDALPQTSSLRHPESDSQVHMHSVSVQLQPSNIMHLVRDEPVLQIEPAPLLLVPNYSKGDPPAKLPEPTALASASFSQTMETARTTPVAVASSSSVTAALPLHSAINFTLPTGNITGGPRRRRRPQANDNDAPADAHIGNQSIAPVTAETLAPTSESANTGTKSRRRRREAATTEETLPEWAPPPLEPVEVPQSEPTRIPPVEPVNIQPPEPDEVPPVEYANETLPEVTSQPIAAPTETNLDSDPAIAEPPESKPAPKKKKKVKRAAVASVVDVGQQQPATATSVHGEPVAEVQVTPADAIQTTRSEAEADKKPRRSRKLKQQGDAAAAASQNNAFSDPVEAVVSQPELPTFENALTASLELPTIGSEVSAAVTDTYTSTKPRRTKKKQQLGAFVTAEPSATMDNAGVQLSFNGTSKAEEVHHETDQPVSIVSSDAELGKKPRRVKKKKSEASDSSQLDVNLNATESQRQSEADAFQSPEALQVVVSDLPQVDVALDLGASLAGPSDTEANKKPRRIKKKKTQVPSTVESDVSLNSFQLHIQPEASNSEVIPNDAEQQVAVDLEASTAASASGDTVAEKKPRTKKKKQIAAKLSGILPQEVSPTISTTHSTLGEQLNGDESAPTTPKVSKKRNLVTPAINLKTADAEPEAELNMRPLQQIEFETSVKSNTSSEPAAVRFAATDDEQPSTSRNVAFNTNTEPSVENAKLVKSKREIEKEKSLQKEAEKARKEREKQEAKEKQKEKAEKERMEKEKAKAEKEKMKAEKKSHKEKPDDASKRRSTAGSSALLDVTPVTVTVTAAAADLAASNSTTTTANASNTTEFQPVAAASAPTSEWAVTTVGQPQLGMPQTTFSAPPAPYNPSFTAPNYTFGYPNYPSYAANSSGGWLGSSVKSTTIGGDEDEVDPLESTL